MIAPEWKILSETSSIQVDIFFLFKKQFTIIFISIVMANMCNDLLILFLIFFSFGIFSSLK